MKKIFLLTLLMTSSLGKAQTTAIPDSFFENALIALGFDDVQDGQVLTSNIASITTIDLGFFDISDLTGIEDFAALEVLECADNLLTSLDLSNNSNLRFLDCEENSINTINLGTNINLEEIWIAFNNLSSVDVSGLTNLHTLLANDNAISQIDLSNNLLLEQLWLDFNMLSEIDLSDHPELFEVYLDENTELDFINIQNGNNSSLDELFATNIGEESCIQVDDAIAATNGTTVPYLNWQIDANSTFSENCTLGITDVLTVDVALFPNPTSNKVTITTSTNQALERAVLYSLQGILLAESSSTELSLLSYPSGTYLIHITLQNGESEYLKVIKQ